MKLFEKLALGYLKDGKLEEYKRHISSIYGLGNLYSAKILNFRDEDLKLYGQLGFAHKYKIDFKDVVSITSGYYPELETNLQKVEDIVNITSKDKEEYMENSLLRLKNNGHDIEIETVDFKKEMELKHLLRNYKHNFSDNFLSDLVENYEDYVSGLYYDTEKYNWNTEKSFWNYFKTCSSLRLENCGENLDSVNNICAGVKKESVDRKEIFNLIKNHTSDKILDGLEIEDNINSIIIKNLYFNTEKISYEYSIKELLKSGYLIKKEEKCIDNILYGVFNLTLYKESEKDFI